MESLAGQIFGQYELRELAGVGGMGAVYRAFQASLDRDVAVKILAPSLGSEPDYLERFTREAKTAAALEHPNIVPIYDYGTQDNHNFVVMRFLSGGTLAQRLHRQRDGDEPLMSLEEIGGLLKGLADALDYAHGQGVIHRDIKPSNIMFDNRGNVSLVDFGIAKLMQNAAALTGTGVSMGTPLYMSPEQWRAEAPSPSTDQYAMGVVVYILVTGQPPFEAPTPYGLMHRHLNDTPTPPQVLRPGVPAAVSQVLLRAMAKTAAERFPTVTAFAQAFDAALERPESGSTELFSALPETEGPPKDTTNIAVPPAFVPPSPAMQAVTPPPPAEEPPVEAQNVADQIVPGGVVLPGTPPEGQPVQLSSEQMNIPDQLPGTPAPAQPIPQQPVQPQYPVQPGMMPDQPQAMPPQYQQQGTPAPGQPMPQQSVPPQYPCSRE